MGRSCVALHRPHSFACDTKAESSAVRRHQGRQKAHGINGIPGLSQIASTVAASRPGKRYPRDLCCGYRADGIPTLGKSSGSGSH